ncbi:hypothetical protein Vca1114GL_04728 [Vibrio campbellii]|uniref:DNA-3-methyladenine glycosylase family protein n=1 Tax=Vibrio campbellii TaxID=680 RepID=UPI00097FABC3|nr:hypothetical protein [Vibrio campbellii]AQM71145.1 hypothetical protein Vca1114GL_04728 [Vibrio campbellii]
MSEIIRKHLMCTYPALAEHIQKCDVIEEKKPSDDKVLTILIQTVIGQMLSRKAAETIFNRVESRIQVVGQLGFLKEEDFTSCGVSKRKAKSILLLIERETIEPDYFESWRTLSYIELQNVINEFWGIGEWTASMLAIFHFGNHDVFPYKDGTIQRALSLLEAQGIKINPELASPYRSHLALYLWQMIDAKIITN